MFQGKEEIRPVDVAQISVVCWMLFIGLLVRIWNLDIYHVFTSATFYLMPSANYQVTAILCNLEIAIIIIIYINVSIACMYPNRFCLSDWSMFYSALSHSVFCVHLQLTLISQRRVPPFPPLVPSIFFKSVALTCYMQFNSFRGHKIVQF